ncbi:MAG: histidine kinase [Clostridia bacterium]|nr:histidine kinase [Clostridia bacterium]
MITEFLSQEAIDTLTMILPLTLILIALSLAVQFDSYISKKHKTVIHCIAVLSFFLIAENCAAVLMALPKRSIPLATLDSAFGYSIRPVILVLFVMIVSPDRKCVWEWVLCGINALLYLSALIWPITFYYEPGGAWIPGPLRNVSLYVCILLLVELTVLTIRKFRNLRRLEILIPMLNVLLIVSSIFLDYSVGDKVQIVSFLSIAIVVSSLFFYIWLHLQFVREHEKALEAEQRIQIMMTQIQPHFLYNTLSTIQSLCHIDPEKAYEVTGKFSAYLRQNLDSLGKCELISLSKETEHTRTYADIEITRFPFIQIIYDIQDEDFLLPALSIQPMVENAIRHGVRVRKDGIVKITADRSQTGHQIVIRDNGKGFDVEKTNETDGHIGIRNVRERIERLCGGTLKIESRIGEGTAVMIDIPFTPSEKKKMADEGKREERT